MKPLFEQFATGLCQKKHPRGQFGPNTHVCNCRRVKSCPEFSLGPVGKICFFFIWTPFVSQMFVTQPVGRPVFAFVIKTNKKKNGFPQSGKMSRVTAGFGLWF